MSGMGDETMQGSAYENLSLKKERERERDFTLLQEQKAELLHALFQLEAHDRYLRQHKDDAYDWALTSFLMEHAKVARHARETFMRISGNTSGVYPVHPILGKESPTRCLHCGSVQL